MYKQPRKFSDMSFQWVLIFERTEKYRKKNVIRNLKIILFLAVNLSLDLKFVSSFFSCYSKKTVTVTKEMAALGLYYNHPLCERTVRGIERVKTKTR